MFSVLIPFLIHLNSIKCACKSQTEFCSDLSKKIELYSKKNKGILEILIIPLDKNKSTDKAKEWSLGVTYFNKEIDPFVESLINKYGVLDQNTKVFIEKHV